MDSKAVRQTFFNFFMKQKHRIVASAPLVNKDDPTLMFTNAGMNQFKDYFLGNRRPEFRRVADTQKCLRVSGKHNDLEEVGLDTYHHTLFEMLGNWSFGDYFKKEAIEWAWELLTTEYKLPAERLYVTVFGGDDTDGLGSDEEAYGFWKNMVPAERIVYGSKKDNFWEMGETGPCGPCSEIHIDLRDEAEVAKIPGKELVNHDHPLVVEIWNLVFMEYNRVASGELVSLPEKHIDTGMGFERLCMAVQNKQSNYDTDVFEPLIGHLAKKASIRYGDDEKKDIALRVMADHVRAVAFAIADGQLPSNTGAGYVIRRILRRAIRYGFTFLDFNKPVIFELVTILDEQLGAVFHELRAQTEFIAKVIAQEESAFLSTLEKGLKRLDSIRANLKRRKEKIIDGPTAFELYDTFGFPFDLTALIARENGLTADEAGFHREMARQKERSKADATLEAGDWTVVKETEGVEFVGYDQTEAKVRIARYRTLKQKGKPVYQIVLDRTPFYAESGGQTGDSGYLSSENEQLRVLDTRKENDLIVHLTDKLPEQVDAVFNAQADQNTRMLTMNNHTATHLLHYALRQVLGTHVEQKGSLVNDSLLRFDFSHFQKTTDDELRQVEETVNALIRQNDPLEEKRNYPIEEAKTMGAMALFGEKYGDKVRVIKFGHSVELCGGTHVPFTGNIGFFKILSESSVAAGVRRIEAVTAGAAAHYVSEQLRVLGQVRQLFKNPKDLPTAANQLIKDKTHLEKKVQQLHADQVKALKKELISQQEVAGGVVKIIKKVALPSADFLKKLSFELKNEIDDLFLVLAADIEGKPLLSVMVSDRLIKEKGLHAGKIISELAKEIKGGGGGQPFFATAGGKDAGGLDKVVINAMDIIP